MSGYVAVGQVKRHYALVKRNITNLCRRHAIYIRELLLFAETFTKQCSKQEGFRFKQIAIYCARIYR